MIAVERSDNTLHSENMRMYKALNRDTGDEIIVLHPQWKDEINQLRRWSRANILICQLCGQPVRVRAGEMRQWHFAHKHLRNCPYRYETPALINARGILYEWLRTKFGDGVTLEKYVRDSSLPRHIDCWVEFGDKTFAYWIFEGTRNPSARSTIKDELNRLASHTNWIFLADLLRRDEDKDVRLHLTTTEREFLQSSSYNIPSHPSAGQPGQTLHYLETEPPFLLTFRNLHLIHSPQLFEGDMFRTDLSSVRVSPLNGEFVHPGEHDRLQEFEKEKEEWEKQYLQRSTRLIRPTQSSGSISTPAQTEAAERADATEQPAARLNTPIMTVQKDEATCVFCGKKTRDWWAFDGATKSCKCYECYRSGRH